MPRRSYASATSYRYGFNGKENDNEPKGLGNQQDYGMRIYDPRLGRFLSTDPIAIEYPWNSSYVYAENDPISNIDLDGLEKVKSTGFMSLIGQGMKKGINEFTGGIKSTSKAVFSGQTYKNAWQGTKNYGNLAMKDPNAAIHNFNKGLISFSTGISNTIQHYTTQPVMWTLNIPNISREENLVGLGYGMWKGFELYVVASAPEIMRQSEADALIGKLESSRFEGYEGNLIIRGALKDGVKVIVAQSADELRYLKSMNSKALYMGGEGNSGSILITSGAPRSHILEEAIHHEQRLLYGDEYFYTNQVKLEIDAQNKLLEIGKREGWSQPEMNEIKKAKSTWESKLKK